MKKLCFAVSFLLIIHVATAQDAWTDYADYDFIPCINTLIYDDFSSSAEGGMPDDWNTDGKGSVIKPSDHDGQWLKLMPDTRYSIDFDVKIPKTFSIEFDMLHKAGRPLKSEMAYFEVDVLAPEEGKPLAAMPPGKSGIEVRFFQNGDVSLAKIEGANTYGHASIAAADIKWKAENEENHIAIWVQNARVRVYVNETKVADIPELMNVDVPCSRIMISSEVAMTEQVALSRFTYSSGEQDIAATFAHDKKVVLKGVYFKPGTALLLPISYPSLKVIADALADDPSMKIKVLAYTDDDLDDAATQQLTQQRADAVVHALLDHFDADLTQMTAQGMGAKNPIAANVSAQGKANNRRIEVVRVVE